MKQSRYYYDLKEHLRYFRRDLGVNCLFGDVVHVPEQPTLLKSRPITGPNENSVLMEAGQVQAFPSATRRTRVCTKEADGGFWRGSVNNPFLREIMVQRFLDDPLCGCRRFAGHAARDAIRKPALTIEAQRQYRYLVSIEGVDVATNLK